MTVQDQQPRSQFSALHPMSRAKCTSKYFSLTCITVYHLAVFAPGTAQAGCCVALTQNIQQNTVTFIPDPKVNHQVIRLFTTTASHSMGLFKQRCWLCCLFTLQNVDWTIEDGSENRSVQATSTVPDLGTRPCFGLQVM